MTDFDAWLATPPPKADPSPTARVGVSKTNPRSSRDFPWLMLTEGEYFNVIDREEEKKAQIREVIAIERMNADQEWEREYRGYGLHYLKDGRTFAARGEAKFIYIPLAVLPHTIKQRLDAQPWPSRDR